MLARPGGRYRGILEAILISPDWPTPPPRLFSLVRQSFAWACTEARMGGLTKNTAVAKPRMAVFVLAVLLAGATFLPAQDQHQIDVKQLVRGVIDNELNGTQGEPSRWRYRLQRQEGDKSTVKEVVETKNCDVHFLVSLNGAALTPD